jgi:spore maturation protein CgeB
MGIKNVSVLEQYYIPWLHFREPLTPADRAKWSSELVFVGHAEPDMRVECFTRAIRLGVQTRLFGGEKIWRAALAPDVFERVRPIQWIPAPDVRKALSGSKIGACFVSKWNRDECTNRTWEIPACGLFLLAERTPSMQNLYIEGEEAEFFDSPEEFIDKVQFYLKNETFRQSIAERGYRRVTASGNDIFSRMKKWCADVDQWRGEGDVLCGSPSDVATACSSQPLESRFS